MSSCLRHELSTSGPPRHLHKYFCYKFYMQVHFGSLRVLRLGQAYFIQTRTYGMGCELITRYIVCYGRTTRSYELATRMLHMCYAQLLKRFCSAIFHDATNKSIVEPTRLLRVYYARFRVGYALATRQLFLLSVVCKGFQVSSAYLQHHT